MANDRPEFTPDLSKLDNRYQILTELSRSGDTRAYLARHLELNRDVTIQVLRPPADADEASAKHLASDARILSSSRHQHVVPVLEELQVGTGEFAVVRPRVRGTTLEQLISTVGTIPNVRVADTLQQVSSALDWARTQGVVHRHVSPSGVVFQQGSGRVLVSFEPNPTLGATMPNACDDARTLGELAWRMLAGQRAAAARVSSLGAVRPELSRSVIREVDALMQCDRNAQAPYVGPLISALDPGRVVAEPPKPRAAEPASIEAGAAAEPLTAPVEGPVANHVIVPAGAAAREDDAVVMVHRGMSFGARLAMAVGVAAVIVLVAILLLSHRGAPAGRTAAGVTPPDTATSATGDVSLRRTEPTVSYDTSAIVRPTTPVSPVVPGAAPGTTTVIAGGRGMIAPPTTRRPEPGVQNPPIVSLPGGTPRDSVRPESTRVDTAARAARDTTQSTSDVCDSRAGADQRACLANSIRENDIALNEAYRKVIAALRRQAGVSDNDPDPPSVDQLRRTEQSWLEWRDATCRNVGEQPLYARSRAACFAQESARRARVLQQKLDSLPQE